MSKRAAWLAALVVVVGGVAPAAAPGGAPGFIRLAQDGAVWWFVDGEGKKFFSLGVDCVEGCYGHAEDRPLPAPDRRRAVDRLRAWGFNTAACWSSPSVWGDLYAADQLYPGYDYDEQDPFDDAFFAGPFRENVRREVAAFVGRREVLGLFLDNEVHWNAGKLFARAAGRKAGTPEGRAFVAWLTERYGGGVAALNAEWGTSAATFADVLGRPVPARVPEPVKDAWRNRVVSEYYRRYAALVREFDPDHLILGVRWSGLPDLGLFQAASRWFDADSVNDYNRYGVLDGKYAIAAAATGKPILITEWSFGGFPDDPDKGSLQFVDVYSQTRRAAGYRKFVLNMARAPFMVGSHWFLYNDYDPRDFNKNGAWGDANLGLTTPDGATVYDELARGCASTNAEVAVVHAAAVASATADGPEPPAATIPRFTPRASGTVAGWPAGGIHPGRITASLVDPGPRTATFYLAADDRYLYVAADVDDTRQDWAGRDYYWESDYVVLYLHPVEPAPGDDRLAGSVMMFPRGGGRAAKDAWASAWEDRPRQGWTTTRRDRPGGYVLWTRVPLKDLGGAPARRRIWDLDVEFQNVNEILTQGWHGRGGFAP